LLIQDNKAASTERHEIRMGRTISMINILDGDPGNTLAGQMMKILYSSIMQR
jgi:hypothetical protein